MKQRKNAYLPPGAELICFQPMEWLKPASRPALEGFRVSQHTYFSARPTLGR